jgi:hypothetical protein
VQVLQSDIDRVFEGTIGVSDLTLVPLFYHVPPGHLFSMAYIRRPGTPEA